MEKTAKLLMAIFLVVGLAAASTITKEGVETPSLNSPDGELNINSDVSIGLGNELKGFSTDTDSSNSALTVGAANGLYISTDGDVLNGSLDMDSNSIQNLANPQNSGDAVNKDYVDSQISGAESSSTQNLSEVLSEGNKADRNIEMGFNQIVGLSTDTTNSNSALTVGDGNDLYLSTDGDVLSGSLDMDGNRIQNLPSPGSSSDAATKNYVDNKDHTDDQQLSIDSSSTDDTISLDNGGSVTISDDYEANSDASTECSGSDYLAGDGSCNADSNTNTQLDDQAAESNVDMAGNNITSSGGEFCMGQYC